MSVDLLSQETLAMFLSEANKATYANKDAPKADASRLESEDYHYEKGNLIYHDTYFGARDFIGEEIIYHNKKPVWGANYFGFVLDSNVSEKDVYAFLREALMHDSDEKVPVRGPATYSNADKSYVFSVEGDLNNFIGKEEISFGSRVVYRCFVHGGMIG